MPEKAMLHSVHIDVGPNRDDAQREIFTQPKTALNPAALGHEVGGVDFDVDGFFGH
jgi:hypothetical protein